MKFILKQNNFLLKKFKGSLILLLCICMSSCGKQKNFCEESGECDLLRRDWEIDTLRIDGVDSLSVFSQHPFYCNTYKFDILKYNNYVIGSQCNSGTDSALGGIWSLSSIEDFFFSFFSDSDSYGPLFKGRENWTIEELTNQSLRMQTTYKNKNYVVHFKAK